MSRKPLDWSKTGTIVAMSKWLRDSSDAIAVVIVRRDDAALVVHADCSPADAMDLLAERLPQLATDLSRARKDGRPGGRVELEGISE